MVKLLLLVVSCVLTFQKALCLFEAEMILEDTADAAVEKLKEWIVSTDLINLAIGLGLSYLSKKSESVVFRCSNSFNKTTKDFQHDEKFFGDKINKSLPIVFLIAQNAYDYDFWRQHTAEEFLNHHETNVCIVLWYDIKDLLETSFEQTTKAAMMVQWFIQTLYYKYDIKYEKMTLVGYRKGTQLAGIVGGLIAEYGYGKIGEIYALNPDYTLSDELFGPTNKINYLDKEDANYVQVVMTTFNENHKLENAHHTFKMNYGKNPQLPCIYQRALDHSTIRTAPCSDKIVTQYFRYSINPANNFYGPTCILPVHDKAYNLVCTAISYNRMGVWANKTSPNGETYQVITSGSILYAYVDFKEEYKKQNRLQEENKKKKQGQKKEGKSKKLIRKKIN